MSKLKAFLGDTYEWRCWYLLLQDTDAVLQSPWGNSRLALRTGVWQGGVESPACFMMIFEAAIRETSAAYGRNEESCFPLLPLTHVAFMDDSIAWQTDMQKMQDRVVQMQRGLRDWGLAINVRKCQLYLTKAYSGPRSLTLEGIVLPAESGFIARARDKFWANSHILCTEGNLAKRLRIMNTVVGGALLWCIGAIAPDKYGLQQINTFMYRVVSWMMRLKRETDESHILFRIRCNRCARDAVHKYLGVRWSTTWLQRTWNYRGHSARAALLPDPPASSLFIQYRTLQWWEAQQRQAGGMRHAGKFFPKLMNLERELNWAAQGIWQDVAQSRVAWRDACERWLRHMDVDWASLTQPSLSM